MAENVLHAEIREATGKEFAKKLRYQGKIPGIFYAQQEKPVPIILDEHDTMKILTSEAGLIDIQIGTKRKRKAIIKDVQTDPVKQSLIHVDIMGVRLKEKINVEVPIHIIGDAIGVKDHGGILHQYLRTVELSCLPLDIPDHIEVDVSDLDIGDSITVGTLSLENVEILGEPEQPIVNVLAPTVSREPVTEAEAAEAEEAAEEATQEETKEES